MPRLPDATALGPYTPKASSPAISIAESPAPKAIAELGQAVSKVGEKLGKEVEEAALYEGMTRYYQFEADQGRYATELMRAGDPQALQKFSEQYNKSANEFRSSVSPSVRDKFTARLSLDATRFRSGFEKAEYARRDAYEVERLDRIEEHLLEKQHRAPEAWKDIQAEGEFMNSSNTLPEATKHKRLQQWRQRSSEALAIGEAERDPQGAYIGLTGRLPPEARQGNAFRWFVRKGYSPVAAAGIVGNLVQESGVRSTGVVGDGGTAFGVAQWREERFDNLKRFAKGQGKDWRDEEVQFAFIDHELNTSEGRAGSALKEAKTPEEAAAAFAHFERPRGYTPDNPRGSHGFSNRARHATLAFRSFGSEDAADDVDDRFKSIPFERRVVFANKAAAEIRRREAEDVVRQKQYVEGVENYRAYVRDGNVGEQKFGLGELRENLPPGLAESVDARLRADEAFGAKVDFIKSASPIAISQLMQEEAAKLDDPGAYKESRSDFAELAKAVQRRNEAIKADPAAYALGNSVVRKSFDAIDSATTPEQQQAATAAYASASIAEQVRLGVAPDAAKILPASRANDILRRFNEQGEGGQNAANIMQSLEAQWGSHWPRVFEQLAADKLPGSAIVIGNMNRPDQRMAAERLAGAVKVGKKDLETAHKDDDLKELKKSVLGEMADFRSTLANNVGGERTFNTYQDAVYTLALSYLGQGDSESQAAKRAYEDVLGKAYTFESTYRVPREINASQVRSGTVRALDTLDKRGIDTPRSLAGIPEAAAKTGYIRALQSNGFFVTAPDESGLVLYDSSKHAVTSGGRPIVFSWDELSNLATQRFTPIGRGRGVRFGSSMEAVELMEQEGTIPDLPYETMRKSTNIEDRRGEPPAKESVFSDIKAALVARHHEQLGQPRGKFDDAIEGAVARDRAMRDLEPVLKELADRAAWFDQMSVGRKGEEPPKKIKEEFKRLGKSLFGNIDWWN